MKDICKNCVSDILFSYSSMLRDFRTSFRSVVMSKKSTVRLGWTLVELLLVVAIVATLAGIAIPAYNNYIDKARNTRAITDIRMMEQKITDFQVENGTLPDTLNQVGLADRLDPWGNPYQYLRIEGKKKSEVAGEWRKDRFLVPLNSDYDLYSMGKNGKSKSPLTAKQSRDDIVRANNGAFVGLGSEY